MKNLHLKGGQYDYNFVFSKIKVSKNKAFAGWLQALSETKKKYSFFYKV
jgi:hypothetical protein